MKFYIFSSSEIKPDFKSKAIMWYTKSSYSHVGIIAGEQIYHAIGQGVCITPEAEFRKTHKYHHMIEVTDYIYDKAFAYGWCEGSIGKDYSEMQLIQIVLKKLRKLVSDGKAEMICSEFTARFLDECSSIPIFDHVDLDFIKPETFIEALEQFLKEEVTKNG